MRNQTVVASSGLFVSVLAQICVYFGLEDNTQLRADLVQLIAAVQTVGALLIPAIATWYRSRNGQKVAVVPKNQIGAAQPVLLGVLAALLLAGVVGCAQWSVPKQLTATGDAITVVADEVGAAYRDRLITSDQRDDLLDGLSEVDAAARLAADAWYLRKDTEETTTALNRADALLSALRARLTSAGVPEHGNQ